ncbi:unnamed protein product [Urochloa decumbens]
MMLSWWGLLATVFAMVKDGKGKKDDEREEFEKPSYKPMIITYIIVATQVLLLGIILCPLGILYMLGLYISAGVSLWRLIEHDFGNAGGANQKPALQVLYSLAVAQGVLFGYKTIHALGARNRLARLAAKLGMVDEDLAAEYLEETIAGCEKDPSFATGRNLVTYGVDLMMEAKSNEAFIAGIRVLGRVIKDKDSWPRGPKVLAKHLLTRSDSSSYIIQRLLEIVGPRSPYSRDVKQHAARIVALVARGIRLQQFPGMIECISSMLDTSEGSRQEYGDNKLKDYQRVELLERYKLNYLRYECKSPDSPDFSLRNLIQRLVQCLPCKRNTMESERQEKRRKNAVHGFDGLLTEAVNIIHQLAFDEGNRRNMGNSVLHHKIAMLPLKLHRENHDACTVSMKSELQMLEKCWVLMEWIVASVKETNSQGQIVEEGWVGCSSPVQPVAPPGGGGRRREKIEEVEEGEEESLLEGYGARSSPLQPASTSGGKGTGETIEDEEERLPMSRLTRIPSLDTAAPLFGGGKERTNGVKIEEEEDGEGERLLRSMVGSALGNAIITNIKSSIKSIFDCLDCRATQKKQGIQILLHLSLNMSFIMDGESRTRRLTWILLLIFLSFRDDSEHWMISGFADQTMNGCSCSHIRTLASEKLADMFREKHEITLEESSARDVQLILLALRDLTSAFADNVEDISIITHAAIILEGICVIYNSGDDFAEELKGIFVSVIPKVVKEILIRCAPTREERPAQATDVEKGVSEYDVLEGKISQDDYVGNEQLRKALVSLCRRGYMKNCRLKPKFKEIASKICKEEKKSFKYFKSLIV